ncbi:Putative metal chaperone YciC [Durusdinium trenchii]|uniref:Metal chaperone YciC n=1 Tax=Durusdinium trenchii TaxID=1381693 RepID=A0ABP0HEB7_9DINO
MPLTFDFGPENRPDVLAKRAKTPVTLLAGFLGSGKTTLLKHLLENQHGLRIGVVVNDLASVNIDSQLMRRYDHGLVEIAELQNGCVCCSSADDLFSAVQTIAMRSKDCPFEHILVELSGIGDPQAIRCNWALATDCQLPAAMLTQLAKVITVVDASAFLADWRDTRKALERNGSAEHDGRGRGKGYSTSREMVGNLLAEQIELADVLVVNKCDLAKAEELSKTLQTLRAINPTAELCQTEFARVPSAVLPPVPIGLKIQTAGQEKGYSWTQTTKEVQLKMPIEKHVKGKDIDFTLRKGSLTLGLKLREVAKGVLAGEVANADDAMFEIESIGQERHVLLCLEKKEPGMWSSLWKQSGVPACGHQHCNGHCFQAKPVRIASEEGRPFWSFVFQRRRPFHGQRLQHLLEEWQDALSCSFDIEQEVLEVDSTSQAALQGVLRSKGFAWSTTEPLRCLRWSQAGRCVSCAPEDYWWQPLNSEQRRFRLSYPGAEAEFRELQQKWHHEWGDCRQELVFIGGSEMVEETIVGLLEECLLTDAEFEEFKVTTSQLKVPDDEFGVEELFRETEALEVSASQQEEQANSDDADTAFLRSLGVGCKLQDSAKFEAVD